MVNVKLLLKHIENLRDNLYNEINGKNAKLTDKLVLRNSCALNKEINEYYRLVDKIRKRYSKVK
ncbi:hypothetical protein BJV85_001108 [Clostridium acetobutylicum]|uniref:Spo0E like sporulation regulatory protein n=1 Tax=Clostridium acetobutylicum (strain ATCC 824 / DSM 792 / JCM 1419 / IAM 19013 / LMG 5710 / NBRC 13948 / NRRL B-527 / VKM B-1787 / 2291 / W) TaxID=272562 RepID=Q97FF5_CLOAB|nr:MULTISPECIES: aspartyl-phosphate phosphatase Spo0E family protein [Clostridium]AAK80729.1 Hypothetical protein CA_C2785 [Clostridium acetobutylicum ATCC 824]ADZ21830.1 Conserved hypothetical protein [Clostridium acetobutylicum EA 2018]AEI32548.1 hypothetical protein SMB_G2821 [Clostridium acetobutylicum DSM 1731]AWV78857.1 Spo0E family sporulation regulatory protein-aspartic acid phosphatase [Clostridium acetobutylicum]KHD37095.1 hypothetical protein NL50_07130 [Clostridium acetobutylicum]